MNNRPYIESVYYTAERKKQLDTVTNERAAPSSSIPDHYFAPKRANGKPLIESSYCLSSASVNYLMEKPKMTGFSYDAEILGKTLAEQDMLDDQMSPVPQQYGERYQPSWCQSLPSGGVQGSLLRGTISQRRIPEQSQEAVIMAGAPRRQDAKMSEYAWQRLDEEIRQRYAIKTWNEEHESVSVTKPSTFTPNETLKKQIHDNEKQEHVPPATRPGDDKQVLVVLPADSEYVGIPNDLFPAYRNTMIEKQRAATLNMVHTLDTADDSVHSDTDKCETAKESTQVCTRLVSQLGTERHEKTPTVHHCSSKTQYSPIGNAFSPVSYPQISEYQLGDLNDLTSFIDAH
nr:unnamed protein product [Haemonchus contortus]